MAPKDLSPQYSWQKYFLRHFYNISEPLCPKGSYNGLKQRAGGGTKNWLRQGDNGWLAPKPPARNLWEVLGSSLGFNVSNTLHMGGTVGFCVMQTKANRRVCPTWVVGGSPLVRSGWVGSVPGSSHTKTLPSTAARTARDQKIEGIQVRLLQKDAKDGSNIE